MKGSVVAAVVGICLNPHLALAQADPEETPPAESKAASSAPPDVVILKSGGMLRGTISELNPDERVVIVLVTGEVRSIEMDQVEYAGPASNVPRPDATKGGEQRTITEIEEALVEGQYEIEDEKDSARPERSREKRAARVDSDKGEVAFDSKEPGLQVHVLVGSAEARVDWTRVTVDAYRPLCTTPCTVALEPGTYQFGVSRDGGDPAGNDDVVTVDDGSRVVVEHKSYAGIRAIGWIAMIGGGLAGFALVMTAGNDCELLDENCEPVNMTQVYAGIGIVVVGGLGGYLLIRKDDESSAQVALSAAPVQAVAVRRRSIALDARADKGAPWSTVLPGLTLTGMF